MREKDIRKTMGLIRRGLNRVIQKHNIACGFEVDVRAAYEAQEQLLLNIEKEVRKAYGLGQQGI